MDLLQIVRWFHLLPDKNLWSLDDRESEGGESPKGEPAGMPKTIDNQVRSALEDAGHLYWISKEVADAAAIGDPWHPAQRREVELLMAIRGVWLAAIRWTPDSTEDTAKTGGLEWVSLKEAAPQCGRKTANTLRNALVSAGLRTFRQEIDGTEKVTTGQLKLFVAYQKLLQKEHAREKKKRYRGGVKSHGAPRKPLILDFGGCGPETGLEEYLDTAQRVLDRLKEAAKSVGLDL